MSVTSSLLNLNKSTTSIQLVGSGSTDANDFNAKDPILERALSESPNKAATEPNSISNNRRKRLLGPITKSRTKIAGLIAIGWSFDEIAEIFQAVDFEIKGYEIKIVYNEVISKK